MEGSPKTMKNAQRPRASGVLLHVSSLWGGYSEGSFGQAAREWVDVLAAGGFRVWQVLPFCLPDDCNSPYKSTGAFSLNPNFIDLPTLAGQGLITPEELESAREETPYACEFERLRRERFALLRRAAARMKDRGPVRRFLKAHPQTDEFCRFMALKEANGNREWTEWTVADPDPGSLLPAAAKRATAPRFVALEACPPVLEYTSVSRTQMFTFSPVAMTWSRPP